MSRDWRPIEQFIWELTMPTINRESFIEDTKWVVDGQEIPMYTEDEKKVFRELPELFLMSSIVTGSNFKDKTTRKVFKKIEKILEKLETDFKEVNKENLEAINSGKTRTLRVNCSVSEERKQEIRSIVNSYHEEESSKELSEIPLNEVIEMWFHGELDDRFYYREYNDRFLENYLTEYINAEKEREHGKDIRNDR